jgi:hypothetical protein
MKKTIYGLLVGLFVVLTLSIPVVAITAEGSNSVMRAPPARWCTITNPADGSTVSGSVLITVDASKIPKIFIDGVKVASASSFSWDTTGYADGTYTISASCPGAADTITVTVDNGGPPPNEFPVVSITNPTAGSTVSNTVTITVTVTDEDTLTADIYIDGTFVATANSYDWDTTAYADGSHTIYAEATDSGSLTDSDSVSVTVDNSVTPPSGDDYFYGSVSSSNVHSWHYFDAGLGTINAELSWDNSYDLDMYLFRPSDYINYVVRAYTVSNPETMSYEADETGMWAIRVTMYTSSASDTDYTLHVTYTPNTPDVTDPTCIITDPVEGETVYKTKFIRVTATDDRNIEYVDFFIDGAKVATDSVGPYSYAWDTTAYTDGSHTIDAIAYDQAGNSGSATQVSVIIDQSAAPQEDPIKYAVIVGISDYKAISDLSYCDEDATDWFNFLTGTLGFLPENIVVLGDGHSNDYPQYDGVATEANIKQALNDMVAMADEDDEISFITSGHGSGDRNWNSYICAWDCGSGESGEDGDFYDYELANILGASIAKQIFVFVDHCYSGGMGDDLMALGNAANILCLTTCTEDGYGWDDGTHHNGMWTYYFVDYSWQQHFNSDPNTALEDVFWYAHDNYPKSGGDEPQIFDGDSGLPMYL